MPGNRFETPIVAAAIITLLGALTRDFGRTCARVR